MYHLSREKVTRSTIGKSVMRGSGIFGSKGVGMAKVHGVRNPLKAKPL